MANRSRSATRYGSLAASGNLDLESTKNSTKGSVRVRSSKFCQAASADVASAGTITVGNGNYAVVTGTTTINYITTTGFTAGSVICLKFSGALTLAHNTGSVPASTAALLLRGSQNLTTTANDTITLVYDGTNWRELARNVTAQRNLGTEAADVASGSTITIVNGNHALVTGTTTINHLTKTGWTGGSVVYLRFGGSVTVTHAAGSVPANTAAIRLAGAANFSATSDDTLTLLYSAASDVWVELARTVI